MYKYERCINLELPIGSIHTKIAVVCLFLAVIASGCINSTTSSKGDFDLLVSDRPAAIDDFDSLDVTFTKARVSREESTNSSENFTEISVDGKTVDLTRVKGAKAQSLVNTSLETGNYSKIELHTSNVEGVVNGSSVEVKLPSEKLQITKNFMVAPNRTTSFVFDIQVVLRGNAQNNQGYILKPVISESGVVGEDVEVEEKESNKPEDRVSPSGGR